MLKRNEPKNSLRRQKAEEYLKNKLSKKELNLNETQTEELLQEFIESMIELEILKDELTKTKEKAEESDRLKSAFLSNMSHEIRTPMSGILGFTELLKDPSLTGEDQQKFIGIIEKSGERLLNTINNIVDFSKVESGLMGLNIKESNINEQIEFVYTFFKPEVESKGVQFSCSCGLDSINTLIKTDVEKVSAVLINLVKNAIKYTDKGIIEFGYEKIKAQYLSFLKFYVKDTGIGIPEDLQSDIFKRFVQADLADTRAFQGTGLGLSISKSYVEMLDGEIWVESNVGKGSVFYFTIPYNPVAEINKDENNGSDNKVKEIQINKLKILIVEDDEISSNLLSKRLEKLSREFLYAKNGVEAVAICFNNPDIDLIMMDIRMPEMDGHEATRQIRLFNKEVIIIAQTAYGFTSDREKAMDAGCNDYVSKPINYTLLFEFIKMLFEKPKEA